MSPVSPFTLVAMIAVANAAPENVNTTAGEQPAPPRITAVSLASTDLHVGEPTHLSLESSAAIDVVVVPGFALHGYGSTSGKNITMDADGAPEVTHTKAADLVPIQSGTWRIGRIGVRWQTLKALPHDPIEWVEITPIEVHVKDQPPLSFESPQEGDKSLPHAFNGLALGDKLEDLMHQRRLVPWDGHIPGWINAELGINLHWEPGYIAFGDDAPILVRTRDDRVQLLGRRVMFTEPVTVESIARSIEERYGRAASKRTCAYAANRQWGLLRADEPEHNKAFILHHGDLHLVVIAHCESNAYASATSATTVLFVDSEKGPRSPHTYDATALAVTADQPALP